MSATPPGDPFLVGAHVVLSDDSHLLQGYNPVTRNITWKDTVPSAPRAVDDHQPGVRHQRWPVAALRPDSGAGQQLWSSPPLPGPLFVGATGTAVFVTVCQPQPGSQPNLCAYQQLAAITG